MNQSQVRASRYTSLKTEYYVLFRVNRYNSLKTRYCDQVRASRYISLKTEYHGQLSDKVNTFQGQESKEGKYTGRINTPV